MKNKQTAMIAIGIISFFVLIAVVIFSQFDRITQRTGEETVYVFPESGPPDDHLLVVADVISVDHIKGNLTLRLEFYPSDDLLDENYRLAEDLSLGIEVAVGDSEILFNKGEWLNSRTVTLNLIGQPNDYPLDSYTAFLTMDLVAPVIEGGETFYEDVPLAVELFTDAPGYDVSVMEFSESELVTEQYLEANESEGFIDLIIKVEHSKPVFAFIIFLTAMQWVLAFTAFLVALLVIVQGRKVTIPNFGWLGALIFAQIALRNAMPGTPPVGTLGDFLAFFYALEIIASSMLALVITWMIRGE